MINEEDYYILTRTYALKIGANVEKLRKEYPQDNYEYYDQLEEELIEFELVCKSDPTYSGEDVPDMYDDKRKKNN